MRSGWQVNVAAVWTAEVLAVGGYFVMYPLLPLFLTQDLSVRAGSSLAFWAGMATGLSGLCMAVVSPVWGATADRWGRRRVFVAVVGLSAVSTALLYFATNPVDVVVICILQGATGGTIAIATAVVATGTPRHRVGRALGITSSAFALGSVVGPAFGAWAARAIGIRSAFPAGGLIILAALVPIVLIVRDRQAVVAVDGAEDRSRGYSLKLLRPIGWVILCQLLMQSSYTAAMLLVVVRIVQIVPSGSALIVSATYSLVGLTAALAAVTESALGDRIGYARFATVGATFLCGGIVLSAAGNLTVLVVAAAVIGLGFGSLGPSLASLVGIAAPPDAYARAYALNSSAMAFGYGAGPLMSGAVSVGLGIGAAQFAAGGVALGLTIVLATVVQRSGRPSDRPTEKTTLPAVPGGMGSDTQSPASNT